MKPILKKGTEQITGKNELNFLLWLVWFEKFFKQSNRPFYVTL